MEDVKAFRFRMKPKAQELAKIRQFAGCRRYVYNRLLAERETAWKALGPTPSPEAKKVFNREWSYVGMASKVTRWRHELDWLAEAPVHILQNAAADLQDAYERWWHKKAGHPRFQRRERGEDSFRESDPACFGINGQAIRLPKLGWVRARMSQKIVGRPCSVTVKQDGEHWFASVVARGEVETPSPNMGPAIGLDVGIVHAIMDSSGHAYELPVATPEEKRKIRHLAQSVSRKQKKSKNRHGAQLRLNRARRKIRNRVSNAVHEITTGITRSHGVIAFEDLKIRNMTASAAGTIDRPGKNVRAKSGLNREILARHWGEIRRQLVYKCLKYGSVPVAVPPMHSSQECSECGRTSAENRESQAVFRCVFCGYGANADHNAARVVMKRGLRILAAGHAASACGDSIRPRRAGRLSRKQEPAYRRAKCVA